MTTTIRAVENVLVTELRPAPRNARTHSEAQIALIAKSIEAFGFTNPILVDGSRNLIAGHGRLAAARKLGWSSVPCLQLEGLSRPRSGTMRHEWGDRRRHPGCGILRDEWHGDFQGNVATGCRIFGNLGGNLGGDGGRFERPGLFLPDPGALFRGDCGKGQAGNFAPASVDLGLAHPGRNYVWEGVEWHPYWQVLAAWQGPLNAEGLRHSMSSTPKSLF